MHYLRADATLRGEALKGAPTATCTDRIMTNAARGYLMCPFLLFDTYRAHYFVRFSSQKWTPHGTWAHREPIAPWRLQLAWRKQLPSRARRHDDGHLGDGRFGEV